MKTAASTLNIASQERCNTLILAALFTLLGLALILPMQGCEDATARQRADAHQTLLEASAELKRVRHVTQRGTPDADARAERELLAIRNKVRPLVSVGTNAQKAAAYQLEAQALRDLAQIATSDVHRLEVQQGDDRFTANQELEQTVLLKSVAESSNALYDALSAEALVTAREEAERYQAQFEAGKNSLEEPITSKQQSIGSTREQISQLESQFNQYAESAALKRGLESLELFERAMKARRQTHQLDQNITENELELRYDLQAEHNFFDSQAQALAELIAALHEAHGNLDEFAATAHSNSQKAQTEYSESATRLRDLLKTLNDRESQKLAPAYEKAQTYLQQAASAANQSSRLRKSGQRSIPTRTAMRCEERIAHLAASRARGLEAQALLFDVIGQAVRVGLLDNSLGGGNAEALSKEAADARKRASEALLRAKQMAPQLPDADRLVANIDDMMGLIGSPTAQAPTVPGTGPTPETTPGFESGGGLDLQLTTGGSPTGTYATPQALLAHVDSLNKISNPSQQFTQMLDVTHFSNPTLKDQISKFGSIIAAFNNLNDAMEQRWGSGLDETLATALEPVPPLGNASVTMQGPDNAEISYAGPFGMPQTAPLIRINGSWMLNGDVEFNKPNFQPAMAMIQNAPKMVSTLNSITSQIRQGKFQSRDEASMALMQSLGAAMGYGP